MQADINERRNPQLCFRARGRALCLLRKASAFPQGAEALVAVAWIKPLLVNGLDLKGRFVTIIAVG